MKINDNIDSLEKYKISYKKSIQSSENFWE